MHTGLDVFIEELSFKQVGQRHDDSLILHILNFGLYILPDGIVELFRKNKFYLQLLSHISVIYLSI